MRKIILTTVLLMLFISCKNDKANKNVNTGHEPVSVSLRFDWITNMNFVGDVLAKDVFAKENGLDLKLEQAGFGVDPIKMVINGTNDFGITSFEQFLIANEQGADIIAIGLINKENPTVFLSLNENFQEPNDFENKKIGINPGGATENVYRLFIEKNNIDDIIEIPTDYNINPFLNNQYDVRLAFAYVEPVDLESKGVKFSIIKPSDFGVKLPGRVYFTTMKIVKDKPEIVQKFMNSVASGLNLALNDKEKAINALYDFDKEIDVKRESNSYDKGKSYFNFDDNQVLYIDMNLIEESAKELKKLGVIKDENVKSYFDNTFIKKYINK